MQVIILLYLYEFVYIYFLVIIFDNIVQLKALKNSSET